MTLSDKIDWCSIDCGIDDNDEDGCYMILEEDVKEFIKKIKKELVKIEHALWVKEIDRINDIIDKLAGPNLI